MPTVEVFIQKLHPDAIIPEYKHDSDAGFDFYVLEEVKVPPLHTALLRTGLAVAIPEGYEIQVRMRSGASLKTSLIIPNSPGTIDSGYRGEIGIPVRNVGPKEYRVTKGERIAQGVLKKVPKAVFVVVDKLPDSDRGQGGFGSTGTK